MTTETGKKRTKGQWKRVISLFLIICMCLSVLAGCSSSTGGQESDKSSESQASSVDKNHIYRDVQMDLGIPISEVNQIACSGGRIYLSGYAYSDEGDASTMIVSCKTDGTDVRVIREDKMGSSEEDEGTYTSVYVTCLSADSDGNVLALLETNISSETSWTSTLKLVKMSSDGTQLWETQLDEMSYGEGMVCGGEWTVVSGDGQILIFNGEGRQTAAIPIEGSRISSLFATADGRVFARYYQGENYVVAELDLDKGVIGQKQDVFWANQNLNVMQGYGYDLFLWNGQMVAGYNFGDENYTEILNFVDSDIDATNVNSFASTGDGSFLLYAYNTDTWEGELYLLSKMDPEDVKDRKVITLASLYQGQLSSTVVKFNKSNEEYRIKLIDYSQYSTDSNPEGNITQLNNDILAGNAPDILLLDSFNMPLESYIGKGLFEDLYTWLDNDPELKREDFLTNVFEAFSTDGKLYRLPTGFTIGTLAGKTSVVGDRTSWTFSDLRELMDQYPDSQSLSLVSRSEILEAYVAFFGSNFMDTVNGTCNFDSQDFIDLLEWAAGFPEEIDFSALGEEYWQNEESYYRENKILLETTSIGDFSDIKQCQSYRFGEPVTFIGFPVSDGNGSVLAEGDLFAMSAKSQEKEGAWQFLRYLLSEEYQSSSSKWDFPVRLDVLEAKAQKATEKQYYLDENGEKVEYENIYWINGVEVKEIPMTQEEADGYVEFIRSVNRTIFYNQEITKIITEEAGAFFSGQKTAEDVAKVIQSRVKIYLSEQG